MCSSFVSTSERTRRTTKFLLFTIRNCIQIRICITLRRRRHRHHHHQLFVDFSDYHCSNVCIWIRMDIYIYALLCARLYQSPQQRDNEFIKYAKDNSGFLSRFLHRFINIPSVHLFARSHSLSK